ncbi:MAG TPA: M50 family metallopeptidase, partial [Bacilli bacterium]|nr:M50 family metallopeptidase [Bacilli bacterium]
MAIIYFIIILGLIIFIHELGHFILAKRNGVYCYEFSLGMGPKIFSFKRKAPDETTYSLRLFPIGGFVQMAGEEIEQDKNIPEENRMQSKTIWQRFKIIVAGAFNNFILGLLLLFLISIIYGSYEIKPYIGEVSESYGAYTAGVISGDLIKSINGKTVNTIDDVLLEIELIDDTETVTMVLEDFDSNTRTIEITPTMDEETDSYVYGFSLASTRTYGLKNAITYTFSEFVSIYKSMFVVLKNLITGGLSINSLSGPVGIYNIVDEQSKIGFENIIYLAAFISINVGFINLLPFPALDGGRVLFLIIEKIRKRPINQKVENTINLIGF